MKKTNISDRIKVFNISDPVIQDINSIANDNVILLDSGASIHIVCDTPLFSKLDKNFSSENSYLQMADGRKSSKIINDRGTAKIPIKDIQGNNCVITLQECLYVSNFTKNIMSINLAIKSGFQFNFNDINKEIMICQMVTYLR